MSELRRFALEEGSDLINLVAGLEQRAPFERDPDRLVERTIYDTFDGRLHAERTVLGHERVVGGPRPRKGSAPVAPWLVWRSADTGDVLGRLAIDQVPTFVWDLPAVPTTDRLAAIVEMRALTTLVTIRSEQVTLRLLDDEGKTEARVVIERATVVWPDPEPVVDPGEEPIEERDPIELPPMVEVVPVRGYPRATERMTGLLAAQVVLRPVAVDVVDAALVAVGLKPGGYSSKLKLRLDPASNALEVVVAVLDVLLATMAANEPGTRGDVDSEFLHDYRVAVRRTRSVLGMAKGVIPYPMLPQLRDDFKWLGDITTPTRDFDVYLLTYPDFEALLPESVRPDLGPLRSFLADHQRVAHAQLVADLDSPRYTALIDRYRSWLVAPAFALGATDPAVIPDAGRPAAEFAASRTWKAYRGLVKDGRRIDPESPAGALHDLRKDAKKLRYALECFGSLFPADEIAPLVKELKGVQDVLGEFQDCEVQKGSLRGYGQALVAEVGPSSAPTLMAMGYLIEQLDERERVARDQFVERFEHFDSHHQRHRFRHLFAPSPEESPS